MKLCLSSFFASVFLSACGTSSESVSKLLSNADSRFSDHRVRLLVNAGLQDNTRVMAELIARGADVNAVGESQITPLILVMAAKQRNAFRFLLEHGADPNWQVLGKDSPGYGESAIGLAAKADDSWFLEQILQRPIRLDLVNPEDGSTPLWAAAFAGRLESVKMLIKAGSELDYVNPRLASTTPMLIAAGADLYDIVWELLEAGANPNISNKVGRRLMDYVQESLSRERGLTGDMRSWCLKVKARLDDQAKATNGLNEAGTRQAESKGERLN